MKPAPYFKRYIKRLNRDLKRLSKENKIRYLTHYRYGLELGLHSNYPNEFAFPSGEIQITDSLTYKAYWGAYEISNQFGPLETGIAKELLSEIEKKKVGFSKKPSFLRKYFWGNSRGRRR